MVKNWSEADVWGALDGYTAAVEEACKFDEGSTGEARAEATARKYLRWIVVRLGCRVDDEFGREMIRKIAGGRR